ncbi:uncharacterized protein [Temnothorax nylanderi]|uniref:uncharacterized protein n=1 Tax=Temnothorax nylanderi TaxID=102681 RepID=UPI003A85E92F
MQKSTEESQDSEKHTETDDELEIVDDPDSQTTRTSSTVSTTSMYSEASRSSFVPTKTKQPRIDMAFQKQKLFMVDTPCKTKDEMMSKDESDSIPLLELDDILSPIKLNDTDENKQPSPSMLFTKITPSLKKGLMMRQSRLTSYTVENNEKMMSSSIEAANILHSDEDEVIEASPMQRSVASKVKNCLKLKRKIPAKRLDFSLCQMENKLKDKVNVSSKKGHLRKDISEHQLNMRCKADRAKLNGWDCWECRDYYKSLSLSKEEEQKRKNQCSRHRYKYERPNTPDGFWDAEFPETDSIDRLFGF